MTLILNNQDVQQILTMEDTIAALEQSYFLLASPGRPSPTNGSSVTAPAKSCYN
jgi:hypothetical protein